MFVARLQIFTLGPITIFYSEENVISIALSWRTRLFFTCLTDTDQLYPCRPSSRCNVLVISHHDCSFSCTVFLERELYMVMYVKTSCHCQVTRSTCRQSTTLARYPAPPGTRRRHSTLRGIMSCSSQNCYFIHRSAPRPRAYVAGARGLRPLDPCTPAPKRR